jgi:hypothetical protein
MERKYDSKGPAEKFKLILVTVTGVKVKFFLWLLK